MLCDLLVYDHFCIVKLRTRRQTDSSSKRTIVQSVILLLIVFGFDGEARTNVAGDKKGRLKLRVQ